MKIRIVLMAAASIMMLQLLGQVSNRQDMSIEDSNVGLDIQTLQKDLRSINRNWLQRDNMANARTTWVKSQNDETSGIHFNGTSWNYIGLAQSTN